MIWLINNEDYFLLRKDKDQLINNLMIDKILYVGKNVNKSNYVIICSNKIYKFLISKSFFCFFIFLIKNNLIELKNYLFIRDFFNVVFIVFFINSKDVGFFNKNVFNVQEKLISLFKISCEASCIKNKCCWPANGKVISYFSSSEVGNKGIDISGSLGQPIFAIANGQVIYVGNALRGYGNLIIIQHGNDYLSAYAHNDSILVSYRQRVLIGQKIATMGKTETNLVKLHFEIRYKGKSVNPLFYLP